MIVKLGDVVDKIVGNEDRQTTKLEYYIGGEHIDSSRILISRRGVLDEDKRRTLGYQFHYPFQPEDVLFMTKNPYLKKCAMVDFEGICSIATFVLRAKDPNVLSQKYLAVVTQTDEFWDYLEANKSGSVNYFITWKTLEKYEFELPDLSVQNQITDLLWAMEDAAQKYQAVIDDTDDLVRVKFTEMFGDIEEKVPLQDCATLHARVGWQALKKEEYMPTGDYLLITGTDFVNGKVNYDTCVYVSKERYDMDENIQVQNGDILITKDGTIGKVAIVEGLPGPATLNAGIFVLRPDGRFNVDYFSYLFKGPIFADFIEVSKTGSTIKHLNQKKLQKYEIPVASQDDQEKFAQIYRKSEQSKVSLQESLDDTRALQSKIILEQVEHRGEE